MDRSSGGEHPLCESFDRRQTGEIELFRHNPGIRMFGANVLCGFVALVHVANSKDHLSPSSSQPLADSESDTTVCASDDGKRPGLIGNVNIFVSGQMHSFAQQLRFCSHV